MRVARTAGAERGHERNGAHDTEHEEKRRPVARPDAVELLAHDAPGGQRQRHAGRESERVLA